MQAPSNKHEDWPHLVFEAKWVALLDKRKKKRGGDIRKMKRRNYGVEDSLPR